MTTRRPGTATTARKAAPAKTAGGAGKAAAAGSAKPLASKRAAAAAAERREVEELDAMLERIRVRGIELTARIDKLRESQS